ncbi:hypothetical protein ACNFU2_08325 [Chryseobacterium sp. PTM-20240506]|uniref:hypothetical protein n=1 Tax=unclassified Chryseobacterium TaxID=2593645 RepID=UPI0023591E39|nr:MULTISPECIES: hypothetical protein [unclassified Chryseobacterium]MDC8104823.1 hypothetical protein [Chryseobacterium sp. B21-037]MDQ1805155.1 hypothetical protein [Chryseobacterium sp. CKR4-1]
MKYIIVLLTLCFNILLGQCNCDQYKKGYEFIKQDFKDKGVEKSYNEILLAKAYGITVYSRLYPINTTQDYRKWLNIDKSSDKVLKKDKCLSKISKLYWQKSWQSSDYYKNPEAFKQEKFKGPSHIAVFTKSINDSLRIDVISNSPNGLKYCGSVHKYLLVFDKENNIKDSKTWVDHYECF